MTLHFLRHGKTSANEKQLYYGQTDLPLSPGGADELRLLKKQNIYPRTDLVFTSGLIRAEQTADIVCGNVHRSVVPELAELSFGLFEMKSHDELKDRDDYQAWVADETGEVECPHGESRSDFRRRVMLGFNTVLDETYRAGVESSFIVCHSGVVAHIMERLFPGTRSFYEWLPKPGRGYTTVYASDKPQIYYEI